MGDINISLEVFARSLHLSCKGIDIFLFDLDDFEYSDDETPLTASQVIHDYDNPALVKNEEMKYYTFTAKILTKIIFYNFLPKSVKYSHTRGCAPLLIYCLPRGIRVNIPKLIINFMLSEHLMIPSRNLPYGMIIPHQLKHLRLMFSERMPLYLQLLLIVPSSKGCKLGLMLTPNTLQFSLHHIIPLVLPLHLQIHTLLL